MINTEPRDRVLEIRGAVDRGSGVRRGERVTGLIERIEPKEANPSTLGAGDIAAAVHQDPAGPRQKTIRIAQGRQLPPGAQERLLRDVRRGGLADHGNGQPVQLRPVPFHQLVERVMVAPLCPAYEIQLRPLHRSSIQTSDKRDLFADEGAVALRWYAAGDDAG